MTDAIGAAIAGNEDTTAELFRAAVQMVSVLLAGEAVDSALRSIQVSMPDTATLFISKVKEGVESVGRNVNRVAEFALRAITPRLLYVDAQVLDVPQASEYNPSQLLNMAGLIEPPSFDTMARLSMNLSLSALDTANPPTPHQVAVWRRMPIESQDRLIARYAYEACRQLCDTDEQIMAVMADAKTIPSLLVGAGASIVVLGSTLGVFKLGAVSAVWLGASGLWLPVLAGALGTGVIATAGLAIDALFPVEQTPVGRALAEIGAPRWVVQTIGSLRVVSIPMALTQNAVDNHPLFQLPELAHAMEDQKQSLLPQVEPADYPLPLGEQQALDEQNDQARAVIAHAVDSATPRVSATVPPSWVRSFAQISRLGTAHGRDHVEHIYVTSTTITNQLEFAVKLLEAADNQSTGDVGDAFYELTQKQLRLSAEIMHSGTPMGRAAMAKDTYDRIRAAWDWILAAWNWTYATLVAITASTATVALHRQNRRQHLQFDEVIQLLREDRPAEIIGRVGQSLPRTPELKRAERKAMKPAAKPTMTIQLAKGEPLARVFAATARRARTHSIPVPTRNPMLMRRLDRTPCGRDLKSRAYTNRSPCSTIGMLALVQCMQLQL